MSDISISGAIGVTFLKRNSRKIMIFYDDHSNTNYCNYPYFIDEFFNDVKENMSNSIILLEEPFVENQENVVFLWNDIPHVIKSKNFYKKIANQQTNKKLCRIFPVDIRLCLIDVSLEEYLPENTQNDIEIIEQVLSSLSENELIEIRNMLTQKNKSIISANEDNDKLFKNTFYSQDLKQKVIRYVLSKLTEENVDILKNMFSEQINKNNKTNDIKNIQGDVTIKDYFKYFLFLFDYGYVDKSKFRENSKIFFIKNDVFDKHKNNALYIQTRNYFISFYDKFVKNEENIKIEDFLIKYKDMQFDYKKGFPFLNDDENNFISQFNRLHNAIMELYAIIIIDTSNYDSIVLYSGYYHSNNIAYILENYFNFEKEGSIGSVDNIENEENEENIKGCVRINKDVVLKYLEN